MTISKEQWAEIERQLSGSWGHVELICDGYKVSAEIQRIASLKLGITVFVDGVIKGEWLNDESEIPKKFHQEKKRRIAKSPMREWYIKNSKSRLWSKEERANYAAQAKATMSFWYPYWTNAAAFCRHIRKTCTSIEIVKIGY